MGSIAKQYKFLSTLPGSAGECLNPKISFFKIINTSHSAYKY